MEPGGAVGCVAARWTKRRHESEGRGRLDTVTGADGSVGAEGGVEEEPSCEMAFKCFVGAVHAMQSLDLQVCLGPGGGCGVCVT